MCDVSVVWWPSEGCTLVFQVKARWMFEVWVPHSDIRYIQSVPDKFNLTIVGFCTVSGRKCYRTCDTWRNTLADNIFKKYFCFATFSFRLKWIHFSYRPNFCAINNLGASLKVSDPLILFLDTSVLSTYISCYSIVKFYILYPFKLKNFQFFCIILISVSYNRSQEFLFDCLWEILFNQCQFISSIPIN